MRRQKRLCATLLALLLLLGAGGCSKAPASPDLPREAEEEAPPEDEALSVVSVKPDAAAEPPVELPEEETGVLWEEGHFLTDAKSGKKIEPPPLPKGGLELPVNGATGYASVELPLWGELPEEEDVRTLSAIDAKLAEIEEEKRAAEAAAAEKAAEEAAKAAEAERNAAEEAAPPQTDGEDPPDAQSGELPEAADTPPESAPPSESAAEANEDGAAEEQTPETMDDAQAAEPPDASDETLAAGEGENEAESEGGEEEEYEPFADALAMLAPGTAFTVLGESGEWWLVSSDEGRGWIEHRYCLVNLPDVVPSMIYNATNSYASLFVSCGKDLPRVTGCALYPGAKRNGRLGRDEFMMPMLYAMAKDVCRAQRSALAEGNTLVLYEAYRPYETQRTVVEALGALCKKDAEVRAAVSDPPWNSSWFIANGYSNHQRGFAMDVSLAKITRAEVRSLDGYEYVNALEYEEYEMPTPIHELSRAAATFTAPVATFSRTAWRSAEMTDAMAGNRPALALQRYCTDTGDMAPLASEWWHFNDLSARESVLDHLSSGGYLIRECRSVSVSEARAAAGL